MSSGERASQRIRLGIIVAVLTALALGSFWVLEIMRRDLNNSLAALPRSKPDYYLENSTTSKWP